ncbi:OLC1v1027213C1 [Oldenlandia corymbosa var. corymbosa]|uniref:OLC1v1027213C1 n=1 Tax=Oldenlandia corymbosa var. corymbosa TaxID=529605 RepID=A0AAV1C8Y1_OLDCO|nr:OLC1v1027213C1 [Oldenlandia corymbosa var. corymbosa]
MEKYNSYTKISNIFTLFLTLLALISLAQATSSAVSPKASRTYKNFIKTKCKTATHSKLCIKTLNPYAPFIQTSDLKLCATAVTVAVEGAKNVSTIVTKLAKKKGLSPRDGAALHDCISDVRDSISVLKQTITAMQHLKGDAVDAKWADAKTWASGAISDAESCRDGFAEKKEVSKDVRKKINSSMGKLEQLMSNALCFIGHLY